MLWSEERAGYVIRRYFDEGATDAQIAQELSEEGGSVSMAAVAQLRRRREPGRVGKPGEKRNQEAILERNEQIRRAIESGETFERVAKDFGISPVWAAAIAPAAIYRRMTYGRLDRIQNPMDRRPLDYALEGEATEAGFDFSDIEIGQCKYPIGRDPDRSGAYRFCGERIPEHGSPYCAKHKAIAVAPSSPGTESYERLLQRLEERGGL